jgi:hypothetical protein
MGIKTGEAEGEYCGVSSVEAACVRRSGVEKEGLGIELEKKAGLFIT